MPKCRGNGCKGALVQPLLVWTN